MGAGELFNQSVQSAVRDPVSGQIREAQNLFGRP